MSAPSRGERGTRQSEEGGLAFGNVPPAFAELPRGRRREGGERSSERGIVSVSFPCRDMWMWFDVSNGERFSQEQHLFGTKS